MPLPCVLGPLTTYCPWGLGWLLPLEKPNLCFQQLLRDPPLPASGLLTTLCCQLFPDPGVRSLPARSDSSMSEPCGIVGTEHKAVVGRVLQPAVTQDAFLSCSSHTCALWRALAVEPSLTTQVLELLLEKMSRDVPFKESRAFLLGSTADRVATLLPLAVSRDFRGYLTCYPCPHMRLGYPKGTWQLCWGS